MVDLISSLPDEIICYILSFLPSQQVVATTVLSKCWNLLWRSVSSLDFDTTIEDFWRRRKTFKTFYSSVYSFLVGRGDQPFYRICLRHICNSSIDITKSIKTHIRTAVSRSDRVQILDLKFHRDIVIPSVVFMFKTLVVLKLEKITVEDISFVDLPLLKILHLKNIISPKKIDLPHLFSGCPNLEVLKVLEVRRHTKGKFIRLSKLVKVSIDKPLLPLEIFKDIEVLKMPIFQPNLNFDFHNLVELQLKVALDWLLVLKVLNHCPRLQNLVIDISKDFDLPRGFDYVWLYPQTVSRCISSHLKSCCLKNYNGFDDEFLFFGGK